MKNKKNTRHCRADSFFDSLGAQFNGTRTRRPLANRTVLTAESHPPPHHPFSSSRRRRRRRRRPVECTVPSGTPTGQSGPEARRSQRVVYVYIQSNSRPRTAPCITYLCAHKYALATYAIHTHTRIITNVSLYTYKCYRRARIRVRTGGPLAAARGREPCESLIRGLKYGPYVLYIRL